MVAKTRLYYCTLEYIKIILVTLAIILIMTIVIKVITTIIMLLMKQ